MNIFRKIKWTFQKIFRKSHFSDLDVWDLFIPLSKKIYLGLLDFKKLKKHGYPEDMYNEENWNNWINEQIEAWEFLMYENYIYPFNSEKKQKNYEIKLFGKQIDYKIDSDFNLYIEKLSFYQEKRKHLMDHFESLWD